MTDIVAYEERERKPYVTSVERIASQRGLQQGLEKGLEQGLEKGLEQGLEKGLEQGLEKGLEQGLVQGRREMLLETLEARFGPLPEELVTLLEQVNDPQLLKELQRPAVISDSLETFEQAILARLS